MANPVELRGPNVFAIEDPKTESGAQVIRFDIAEVTAKGIKGVKDGPVSAKELKRLEDGKTAPGTQEKAPQVRRVAVKADTPAEPPAEGSKPEDKENTDGPIMESPPPVAGFSDDIFHAWAAWGTGRGLGKGKICGCVELGPQGPKTLTVELDRSYRQFPTRKTQEPLLELKADSDLQAPEVPSP